MTVTSIKLFPFVQPYRRLGTHVIAIWVVTSFIGTLTICCDLFAATTDQSPVPVFSSAEGDVSHTASHGHHHIHGDKQASELAPDNSEHCSANNIPDLAVLNYVYMQLPDTSKKLSAEDSCSSPLLMHRPVSIKQFQSEPPPISPPRYLLFRRLLIAHPDA